MEKLRNKLNLKTIPITVLDIVALSLLPINIKQDGILSSIINLLPILLLNFIFIKGEYCYDNYIRESYLGEALTIRIICITTILSCIGLTAVTLALLVTEKKWNSLYIGSLVYLFFIINACVIGLVEADSIKQKHKIKEVA